MKSKSLLALLITLLISQPGNSGLTYTELATGARSSTQGQRFIAPKALQVEEVEKAAVQNSGDQSKLDLKYYQSGIASHYWQPQGTGCPPYKRFNPKAMTAAHKKLPCGTKIKVTNLDNKKSVIVVINDRGPYVGNRILDLSEASFLKIAQKSSGLTRVKIEIVK